MLQFEVRRAPNDVANPPLIILMHGRGANRFDLLSLAEPMPAHANIVLPEAPFDAARWGYGPGSAWYRFIDRNMPEPESFSRSLDELKELVEHFNAQQVVVGGFSQGGTLGLGYALSHPGEVLGILNFSGFVADHPRVLVSPQTVDDSSFFWGHGTQDTNIPFALAVEGRAQLRAAGAKLEMHDYTIGHRIAPEELDDAIQWVGSVLKL
ncbi:MAG: alpha/beta hydrolase [Gemmatimonadota bacterium]